ncbi:hypothetical protein [Chamaesiphon sp. VAR_69_metabat_338]|nr:hypothetical protein [Chamaesiphon sp. VAR_69_metabat_338]
MPIEQPECLPKLITIIDILRSKAAIARNCPSGRLFADYKRIVGVAYHR